MIRSLLFDIAQGTLQTIVAHWPAPPVEPLPARTSVSDFDGVWDCDQLAVVIERLGPTQGDVTQEQYSASEPLLGLRSATMAIWLLRCVPELENVGQDVMLPKPQAITDSAEIILGDALTIIDLVVDGQQSGDLPDDRTMTFVEWQPARSGGFGGGIVRFRVQLL